MDQLPRISSDRLKAFLHERVDEVAEQIVAAMNAAAPGRLIGDTEEPVRQALAALSRAAYEAALQQKIDAAEAAFPPSAGSGGRHAAR
jgi:hypothetical protein